jgi:hypothetical protein
MGGFRVSLGPATTEDDVDRFLGVLPTSSAGSSWSSASPPRRWRVSARRRTPRDERPSGWLALPTPVWLVLGAALGAAIGSGGGDNSAGLAVGLVLGACGGVGLASWLGRRS